MSINDKILAQVEKVKQDKSDFSELDQLEIAKNVFGFYGLKQNGQDKIIKAVLEKENILGILPTGGGKSACYQIPALMRDGITIVVSPLISLMKDQVDSLVEKKIYSAFFINYQVENNVREEIMKLIENNKVKLLYIAPESLQSERIQNIIKKSKVNLITIDESHCISTWGHNFRPDYLKLSRIIENLGSPPVLALTATATKVVQKDIIFQLDNNFKVIKSSFDRPLLYLVVHNVPDDVNKEVFLLKLVRELNGPTIIYTMTQDLSENISRFLNQHGIKSTYYHGGLEPEEKEKIQDIFMQGKCDIIVATLAFGMGIDKEDIRNVIHYNLPQSVENYYQEVGRAGRDGEKSNCILLYTEGDISRMKSIISSNWPNKQRIEDLIEYLKNKPNKQIFANPKSLEYQTDIKETPVKLILHRLEAAGVIKTYSKVLHNLKVIFNKSPERIVDLVENKYKEDVKTILLSEYFKHIKFRVNLEVLIEETKLNYFRILEIFRYLSDKGHIRVMDEKNKDLIMISSKLDSFKIDPLVDLFQKILESNHKKVDELVACLNSKECIRKGVLSYFDEKNLKNNCEMCSNCINYEFINKIPMEVNKNYAKDEEIGELENCDIYGEKDELHETILKCIALDKIIPNKNFIDILKGSLYHSSSKWKFKLNSYGLLSDIERSEIEEELNKLISDELVHVTIEGRLRITKRGIDYLDGR